MSKAILFIVLMLSAQIVNADTYPASFSVGVFPSTCSSDFSSGIECYRRYKCVLSGYDPDTIASTIPLYTSYCPRPAYDLTEDSGYYHVTWNWGETSNLAYRSENFLKTYSCPHGGTLSGTSCINAPACTAPQVRDATGECKASARTCSATEYDNGTACVPIPNCNADQIIGIGFYFDVVTKACVRSTEELTLCIGGSSEFFCPPIQDCKPKSYVCTNSQVVVNEATATRLAEIAASKASAEKKQAEIVEIALQAEAAAAAKRAALDKAKADKDAALQAVKDAKAGNDQSLLKSAFEAYQKFAADYIDSLAKLSNSELAKTKVKEIEEEVKFPVSQIPTSNPGNSRAYEKQVDDLLPKAITGLDDAISGDGSGTGPGSGQPTTTTPQLDTKDLNKESTQGKIADGIGKIADALGQPGEGPDLTDVDKSVRDAMQGIVDGVAGVDTSLGTNPAAQLGITSSYWSYASGTCYAHSFDMGRFGSISLENFCKIYDEHVRAVLVLIFGFFGVMHVFSYWAEIIQKSMGV